MQNDRILDRNDDNDDVADDDDVDDDDNDDDDNDDGQHSHLLLGQSLYLHCRLTVSLIRGNDEDKS